MFHCSTETDVTLVCAKTTMTKLLEGDEIKLIMQIRRAHPEIFPAVGFLNYFEV